MRGWLSNIPDPNRIDRWLLPVTQETAALEIYLRDKTVGPPKRSRWYSVEQLERMGMIGVYV